MVNFHCQLDKSRLALEGSLKEGLPRSGLPVSMSEKLS